MGICLTTTGGLVIAEETTAQQKVSAADQPAKGRQQWLWWVLLAAALIIPVIIFVQMPETPLDRAISLVKANKAAAALPVLEDIASKEPDNHEIMPWLALCYLATDRLAEGRTALDTAMKAKLPCATVRPSAETYIHYYEQKNDFREAERLLSKLGNMCPNESTEEARTRIYLSWADYDANQGKLEDAINHLQLASADMTDGDQKTGVLHKLADHYRRLAATQEYPNAVQLLEQSLSVSDEPATRMALSELYTNKGEGAKALEHLRKVSQMDPNNLEARHRAVELCLKLNDIRGAQQSQQELAEKEHSVENFALLADLNLKLNNYAAAVRALEEASNLSRNDASVLGQLHAALLAWSQTLDGQGKHEESISVKARAERIAEILKDLGGIPPEEVTKAAPEAGTEGPTITLASSRIWLSRGSYTPEGEIGVKNTGDAQINDLPLTMVFFDNTTKKRMGTVTVSAASEAHPMTPGQTRTIYFSSPSTVRAEHKLCVLIFWKGRLIRELPVVKER